MTKSKPLTEEELAKEMEKFRYEFEPTGDGSIAKVKFVGHPVMQLIKPHLRQPYYEERKPGDDMWPVKDPGYYSAMAMVEQERLANQVLSQRDKIK
jgi:hypothetical protein